jgi:hypothetical protein
MRAVAGRAILGFYHCRSFVMVPSIPHYVQCSHTPKAVQVILRMSTAEIRYCRAVPVNLSTATLADVDDSYY